MKAVLSVACRLGLKPNKNTQKATVTDFISNLKKSPGLQLLISSSAVFYFQLKEVPRTSLTTYTGEFGHAVAEDFVIDAKYDDKDKWQGQSPHR